MSTVKSIALAAVFLGLGSMGVAAEVVVVASKENSTSTLSLAQVTNIFLGRSGHFPDGDRAIPVDQGEDSAAREEFYREVVGWTAAQRKAHWSKLIFTGRGQPPRQVRNDEEMIDFLVANPAAIGYVDKANVSADLRIFQLSQ